MNILLIYTDQQRYDAIHSLGNSVIQTPNLDRLVSEGVAFTNATTPCPVCMAARWSLHTGQWTTTHRCYSNHHPGQRPAFDLPGLLRNAGYRTGLVGKNHSFLKPEDMDAWIPGPRPAAPRAWQERQKWVSEIGKTEFPRLAEEAVPGGVEADPARAKTNAALDFIQSCDGEPFFLWLSYHHPHTPYYVPEPFFSMYLKAPVPEPEVEPGGLEASGKPFRQCFHQRNNDAILPFDHGQIMTMRRVYYGMISLIDAEIGRLLALLDRNGLRENTLIVFACDHGDYMGDHGLITKSPALYDCLVRVPLIISQPCSIPENERNGGLVSTVDLMPTFLSAAGVGCPEAVQGINILPYLKSGNEGIRPAVFSEYGVPGIPYDQSRLSAEGLDQTLFHNPWDDLLPWEGNPVSLSGRIRMVRTHEWKLIEEPGGTSELYDLNQDPYELINLYGVPEFSSIQEELNIQLQIWKQTLPDIEDGKI